MNKISLVPQGHRFSFTGTDYQMQMLKLDLQIKAPIALKDVTEDYANFQSFENLIYEDIPIEKSFAYKAFTDPFLQCYYCQANDFIIEGKEIRAKKPCSYEHGIECQVELNIPSGKMVIGNDFRSHFDIEEDFEVNTGMGIYKTVQAFAEQKCLHSYVGNSCPSVYKINDQHFTVASSGYDEKTDKELFVEGEKVASIITDLWWVSIVDYDEAEKTGLLYEDLDYTVVDVIPGAYILDYHGLKKGFDFHSSNTVIYAELKLKK